MPETFCRASALAACLIGATLALSLTPLSAAQAAPLEIAQIQGTDTPKSTLVNTTVTTEGFVTAVYSSGGFDGYFIQTPGTGGDVDVTTHRASDALFVYSPSTVGTVSRGDLVRVTGRVSEYGAATLPYGTMTQITVSSSASLTKLDPASAPQPKPARVKLPGSDADRETLEGMLIEPLGDYVANDVYATLQYGEVELAAGTTPLKTPNSVAPYGTPAHAAVVAANAAARITLDDGTSYNFSTPSRTSIPNAYIGTPVRVGSDVTFRAPVVLDYRYDKWRFQPLTALTGDNEGTDGSATFSDTRTAQPEDVGGELRLSSFNVLNYFPTTGDTRTGCTYYRDRDGVPVTVNDSSAAGCGVRGAATDLSLARQERKMVNALIALDADIIAIEEIENSLTLGKSRDDAIGTLVAKLNERLGADMWAYVPSPKVLPPLSEQGAIRTGMIYRTDTVETVGESVILTGSAAFANARQPEAQAFRPKWGGSAETFLVIGNHFKSKSPSSPKGDNVDSGQGAHNGDRVRQANALLAFANDMAGEAGTDKIFLVGDFNAYEKEDPTLVITGAGYTDLGAGTGESTYAYQGGSGSLDHVFASAAAVGIVAGTDIWNAHSGEPLTSRYSYFNYNAVNPFNPKSPFGASDHDPIVVGLSVGAHTPPVREPRS